MVREQWIEEDRYGLGFSKKVNVLSLSNFKHSKAFNSTSKLSICLCQCQKTSEEP